MSNRKIILSQEQYERLSKGRLEEDTFDYFDDAAEGNLDFDSDGGPNRIFTHEPCGITKSGDDFACSTAPGYSYRLHGIHESKKQGWQVKKKINEEASDALQNKPISFGQQDTVNYNNAKVINGRVKDAKKKANSNDPTIREKGKKTLSKMAKNHDYEVGINHYNSLKNINQNSQKMKSMLNAPYTKEGEEKVNEPSEENGTITYFE